MGVVLMEFLTTTQAILGLLVSSATAAIAVIYWFHNRMKKVASAVNSESRIAHQSMSVRMRELENDLKTTSAEVHTLNGRVAGVERTLETVARQSDLALLSAQMGEFRGAVSAELRMVTGQIDTLYKAALRSSNKATEK